jgi:hypothetical protein
MSTKLIVTVVSVGVLIAGGAVLWSQHGQNSAQSISATSTTTNATASPKSQTSSTTTVGTDRLGMKLYRNEQFGFEFWYPEDWKISESFNSNPNNKLIVSAFPVDPNGESPYFVPFEVLATVTGNISRFIESVQATAATSTIELDGQQFTEYRYADEASHETVVIPRGTYPLLVSNDNNSNVNEFAKILTSFKFTK